MIHRRAVVWVVVSLVVILARTTSAANLTVVWDENPDPALVGYVISYGTTSGVHSTRVDTGRSNSWPLFGLVDGGTYFFIVQGYDAAGHLSSPSAEFSNVAGGGSSVPPPPPSQLSVVCPSPTGVSPTGSPVAVTYPGVTVSGGTAPYTAACAPPSGSMFPVGSTAFTCSVTDTLRQTSSCSSTVTVTLGTPSAPTAPTIMCPAPFAVSRNGLPVAVTFAATVSGGTSPVTTTCTPASGTLFNVGTTSLTCAARDALALTASCSSAVTVRLGDGALLPPPPAIVCPVIPKVTSSNGVPVPVTYSSPTVTGGVAPVTTACNPSSGSLFALGTTTMTCKATDTQARTASCSVPVTVVTGTTSKAPWAPNSPSPADGATNVIPQFIASWVADASSRSYSLYLGKTANPPLFKSGLKRPSTWVEGLSRNTTYYWRVVAKNDAGATSSAVWKFTTKP